MPRTANEHESAAFLLVENTIRRSRPNLSRRGLESVVAPAGRIERGWLGRLRLRYDGDGSPHDPENGHRTRALSDEEISWWASIERMFAVLKPIADSDWNLVSMRIGPRRLFRSPRGRVLAVEPEGIAPFERSLRGAAPLVQPESELALPPFALTEQELELLRAIDVFLQELDEIRPVVEPLAPEWNPFIAAKGAGYLGKSGLLHRGGRLARGKWSKCPICHAPVAQGRFNPRIPHGRLRPGVGAIVDLRGGYLARLRETYIIDDPKTFIESPEPSESETENPTPPRGQASEVG